MSKRGRCLWLMNHRTLRAFEVPMLIDMGFEVFCPKSFPYDEGNLSADITYEYDETLTIPDSDLEHLNEQNFYDVVSRETMEILNKYFDVVFIGFFPKQLKMIVEGFQGVVIMQPFGLSNGLTYTQVIADTLGINFMDKIESLQDRFIFGQAYENIADIECRILKNRAMYLPLGLKNAYVNDEWEGGDKRILFVCPRINTSPYFKKIYTDFKNNFKEYDYLIGGAQPIEVRNDAKVAGFIPNDQYAYNMKHLNVMFYHSREERHVHYHPFEAIKCGMPLIFMSGGILDSLGGDKLPGRCKTIKEAKNKINRIMSGDKAFIRKVKSSQGVLLKRFTNEYCYEMWNQNLDYIQAQIEKTRMNKSSMVQSKKKIGVLLSEGYLGGVFDVAVRLVESLQRSIEEENAPIELVFGYLDHKNFEEDTFTEIKELGIPVRKFDWKYLKNYEVNNIYRLKNYNLKANKSEYCIADDGINCFEDCDHILFIVDRVPTYYFTNRPYSVIVHDYIQRYLSSIMDDEIEDVIFDLQRNAEAIYVMTTAAKADAIQYAGINSKDIKLLPLFLKKADTSKIIDTAFEENQDNYFVWSTNIGEHKNHLMLLKALSKYYEAGGKLKCYVTGVNTENFDVKKKMKIDTEHIRNTRKLINKDKNLAKNIVFKGNMSKQEYYHVLSKAAFMVHPGYTDNGNMSCVDAAFLGVPTITSDYPAMRYYEDVLHLNLRFVSPYNPVAWKDMLFQCQDDYKQWKKTLPKENELEKHTVSHTYKKIYDIVCEVAGIQ